MASMLVTTLAKSAGSLMVYETSNVTNTRTKIDLGTSANAVEIDPDISSSVLMSYLG